MCFACSKTRRGAAGSVSMAIPLRILRPEINSNEYRWTCRLGPKRRCVAATNIYEYVLPLCSVATLCQALVYLSGRVSVLLAKLRSKSRCRYQLGGVSFVLAKLRVVAKCHQHAQMLAHILCVAWLQKAWALLNRFGSLSTVRFEAQIVGRPNSSVSEATQGC